MCVIGNLNAAVVLLLAPESGVRTRRGLADKGEDAGAYVVDAGKELTNVAMIL